MKFIKRLLKGIYHTFYGEHSRSVNRYGRE